MSNVKSCHLTWLITERECFCLTLKSIFEGIGILVFIIFIFAVCHYIYTFIAREINVIKIRKLEEKLEKADHPLARCNISRELEGRKFKNYPYLNWEKESKDVLLILGITVVALVLNYIWSKLR